MAAQGLRFCQAGKRVQRMLRHADFQVSFRLPLILS
jgi:hypothetical protein